MPARSCQSQTQKTQSRRRVVLHAHGGKGMRFKAQRIEAHKGRNARITYVHTTAQWTVVYGVHTVDARLHLCSTQAVTADDRSRWLQVGQAREWCRVAAFDPALATKTGVNHEKAGFSGRYLAAEASHTVSTTIHSLPPTVLTGGLHHLRWNCLVWPRLAPD